MNEMTRRGDVFDLVASVANSVNMQTQNVNALVGKVGQIEKKVDEMKEEFHGQINGLKKAIDDIKNNGEITTEQRKNIKRKVNAQVYRLLGLPEHKDKFSFEDKVTLQKYGHIFHQRCYAEVSRMGHLGNPFGTTVEKDYIQAVKDIEAWTPSNGIVGLMGEADENAKARKIAQEQGY